MKLPTGVRPNVPRQAEQLLRDYKAHGGEVRLAAVLREYRAQLRALAYHLAPRSASGLNDADDLLSIAEQAVYFSALAYEFRCPRCPKLDRAAHFLTLAGLRDHGRRQHRTLGLEPRSTLNGYVLIRAERSMLKVLEKERAKQRAGDRLRARAVAFEEDDEAPLDRVAGHGWGGWGEGDVIFALDAGRAARAGLLPRREADILTSLLDGRTGPEVAADLEAPYALTAGSARVITSRARGGVRHGRFLPGLWSRDPRTFKGN